MKKLILFTILILSFTFAAKAQEVTPTPPKVEITQETADKCADAFTERKALKAEIEVKDKAIEDLKAEIVRLRIELGKLTGEKNGSDAMVIRLSALLDLAMKNTKKKRIGLITIF